jgi:hypothetical protein
MAYDAARHRLVCSDGLLQTWEWDGSAWILVPTNISQAASRAGMAFHAGRGKVMMFGGASYNGFSMRGHNDLWEWDGSNWTLVPVTAPPPVSIGGQTVLVYTSLGYDARRDKLVVSGEHHHGSGGLYYGYFPVTWEWSAATDWQLVNAGGVAAAGPVFDAARGVLVNLTGDFGWIQAWEWNGTGLWTAVGPTGAISAAATDDFVYDSRRRRILVLGLNGDLWAYEPTNPAQIALHGTGCPSTFGISGLDVTFPWTLPWLGRTFSVDLAPLPQQVAILTLGVDDRSLGTAPLPLDLTFLGMPGCAARVAPLAWELLMSTGNAATFSMPIPNDNLLMGRSLLQQAVVWSPGSNPAGLVVSDSMRATVGRPF